MTGEQSHWIQQWLSREGDFAPAPPWGLLTEFGDIVICHIWGGATGTYWAEARDVAQHCTMHRKAPHKKGLSGPIWE